MKETPIIFSSEMVSAILGRHKTQTRRVIKPTNETRWLVSPELEWADSYVTNPDNGLINYCPYGKKGDQIWVRETWRVNGNEHDYAIASKDEVFYKVSEPWNTEPKWKPSIFMPRWASRIQLEVEGVRVERLQDISESDAMAEGVQYCLVPEHHGCYGNEAICAFSDLWDQINAQRGYSWASNPWVWVIEFDMID